MRARRFTAVAAAATMVLVAGCGGGDNDSDNDSNNVGNEDNEGTGTVGMALTQDMETLLPMDSNIGDNIHVLDVLYSGLVRYDTETAEPYNYIAEDISTEDNVTWTIAIKEGFTFHNGEPVDAAAFARAWNYAAYGPNAMANNYFFDKIVGYEELQAETDDDGNVVEEPAAEELSGLTIVDDYTLEVQLNAPFAGFATMLGYTGFFPVAEECIANVEDCSVNPIGNGPFQIEDWTQGVSLTATRWDEYAGDEAPSSYDQIEWTEYSGTSSWPDFQAGDLDTGAPPPAEMASAMNNADLTERMVERPGAALTYLGFPMYQGAPYDNIDFRKAISLAIDRESVIEQVLPGRATAADSWVVPGGVPGGEAGTCDWCHFDPDEAKSLLDAAGGWPEGEVLTIHLGEDATNEEYFRAIGDQIRLNLGIEYELDPTPDFFSRRRGQDFNGIFRNNWFPDYPLNENYIAPTYVGSGEAQFGYTSEAFNAAIDAANNAATLDEAIAGYQDAEAILNEEFPTAPLSFSTAITFYSENVDNVVVDPFSGYTKLRLLEYVG